MKTFKISNYKAIKALAPQSISQLRKAQKTNNTHHINQILTHIDLLITRYHPNNEIINTQFNALIKEFTK